MFSSAALSAKRKGFLGDDGFTPAGGGVVARPDPWNQKQEKRS
jgi:hypothetical protein